ncbi:PepSY domain-containing protein [Nocardioides pocheonensis]|uniref:PepSY domain-containing protein n=1 Tax=Nocardioides pocheonensis TaxID=661485 RepID=A0A3N0GW28_9ACTN|nr:PepSY domain-containing protein [Nocardioides pocheonensis]RNM16352.1 hypothetical protein EFL26_05230 [Nocardioides pocheonensis]
MQKKATALLVSTGVAGLLAGGVLMGTMSANAADDSSATSGTSSYGTSQPGTTPAGQTGTGAPNGNNDPSKPMRSDEKLLTGDTKDKVTAAVKAKYPNATFQRVETDSDGVYEAHILDHGKPVIVQVDATFTVTGTQSMPTAPQGDANGDGPAGQPSTQAPAA